MSSSVFGTPVTEAMLRKMPEYQYKNPITQQDLAKVALTMVNAEGKSMEARKFLEHLQFRFGQDYVSTMCLIYNATGANMRFVVAHDWFGRLCESPYPVIVANGQWGVFLHGQYYDRDRASSSAIVYSALNNKGVKKDWILAYYNSDSGHNWVKVAIVNPLVYDPENKKGFWSDLEKHQKGSVGSATHVTENGGYMSGSIGETPTTVVEAIMTLPEVI